MEHKMKSYKLIIIITLCLSNIFAIEELPIGFTVEEWSNRYLINEMRNRFFIVFNDLFKIKVGQR